MFQVLRSEGLPHKKNNKELKSNFLVFVLTFFLLSKHSYKQEIRILVFTDYFRDIKNFPVGFHIGMFINQNKMNENAKKNFFSCIIFILGMFGPLVGSAFLIKDF